MRLGKNGLICIFFFSLLPILGWTVEYRPWIGNYLEFEWNSTLRFQAFQDLAAGSHRFPYASDDFFLTTSLALAAKPDFSLDVEATAARTRRQSGSIDQIRLNGRIVWLDDIVGDPVTLTTGAGFIQAFDWSLKDKSSFHHGRSEAEIFLSVGKEWAQGDQWISRAWAMAALGSAARGSPWMRYDMAYAQRIKQCHEFEFFVHTLWGLGSKQLHRSHFHGYGAIDHQSIDLGCRYTYLIQFFGSASIEYAKRVYARNFPVQAHQISLSLLYTFGL